MEGEGENATMHLSPDVWKVLRPMEHCASHLSHGVRWDGRKLLDRRPILVKKNVLSTATNPHIIGSAQVQLGGTVVMSSISLYVVRFAPSEVSTLELHRTGYEDTPGDVVCKVLFDAMNCGRAENKDPPEQSVDLQNVIETFLNNGIALDRHQLIIEKGLYSYRLSVEVTVLSAHGNLRDATLMATIAALRSARLPKAIIKPDTVEITTDEYTEIKFHPCIPLTFSSVNGVIFLDGSEAEDSLATSQATIVIDPTATTSYFLSTVGSELSVPKLFALAKEVLPRYADFLAAL